MNKDISKKEVEIMKTLFMLLMKHLTSYQVLLMAEEALLS